ncbi:MAG TPA: DEAD/DEAH box helicase [Flavobacteriales bacterium]|nr:DEAD/DEAH box helicase [Flavobacteriales bacterium]
MNMPLYEHQQQTVDFLSRAPRALITSDPGTGKTRAVLERYYQARTNGETTKRMLVLAPLSILKPSWGDDIERFTPGLTYSIAYSKNRMKAFQMDTDIVITNHDAVKWIANNAEDLLGDFDWLVIDEFTVYKHRTSQRSKAAAYIRKFFEYRIALSGTPNSNTILDVWHPTLIVDDGERLGTHFFSFRAQVCEPKQVGPATNMVQWIDKEDAEEKLAASVKDITIRHRFEDCLTIPEHSKHQIYTDLAASHLERYNELRETSLLELEDGEYIEALHAGVLVKKLLQVASGAVYDSEGVAHTVNTERYALVIELVQQRKHSLVAFNWAHERDALCKLAEKAGITFAVIDGKVSARERISIVEHFQEGDYQVLFAHPQSAAHGLTLTKATTTIWTSPTYNAEHFQQFNRRIYRAGQTQKTETILIAARETWEPAVYKKLDSKLTRMESLLDILKNITELEPCKKQVN